MELTMSDSTNTQAPAAAPAPAFDFAASGRAFALSEGQRGRLLQELGEQLKGADFAHWNAARDLFIAGALAAGWLAAEKLWERTIKAGNELGLIPEKPKATGPAATKQAAKREAQAAELAKVAEGKTPAQLRVEAAKHLAAGKASKESDAMLKAAEAIEKAADKAARDKAREAIKAADDRIRAARTALKEAGAIKALQALADAASAVNLARFGGLFFVPTFRRLLYA
jgi:colicin import membrane protein